MTDSVENKQEDTVIDQENQGSQNDQTQESNEERNWRQFREKQKETQRLAQEAEERARREKEQREAMEKAYMAVFQKQNDYVEEESDVNEGKKELNIEHQVMSVLEKWEEKKRKEQEDKERAELPDRLRRDFQDFDVVCSDENLSYLEYHYPEIAVGYNHMPNGYDRWACIYKAVKRLIKNPESSKKQKETAPHPESLASANGSTSSRESVPYMMTEEKRAANWDRMQKVMKGLPV